MGIKLRNKDEDFDRLALPSTHSVGTDFDTITVPFSGSIKAIKADIGVAGVTGTATVNLKKNQANMFANATPFTWATASLVTVYDATDFASGTVLNVTKGDKISLDITVIQTTPAKGGYVYILFSRRPNNQVVTASLDPQDSRS